MTDILFDIPLWIPAILAIFGAVVFWNGNTRQNRALRINGISVIIVAVAWFALSYFVDTDKEKAQKGTEQLLAMVSHGDWSGFRAKLAPDVTFRYAGGNANTSGSDQVAQYAQAGAQMIQLNSAYMQHSDVEQTGTIITVTANIFSNQSAPGSPPTMNSKFQFDWKLLNEGWRVSDIRLLQIGDVQDRDLQSALQRVR
ncbi:MAG TPA: nuclear transport factor 2 family protein [Humisphaera sp.]|jgi:hypothetical protein|nr:nuclear transport factor 2 family protein [Humisphaera sp.]